jgi:hypothetical protein
MCGRLPACRFTGRSRPCFGRQEYVFGVAQICNLLYRRIAFCGTPASVSALKLSNALPITNRRYGRLQICATTPRYRGPLLWSIALCWRSIVDALDSA